MSEHTLPEDCSRWPANPFDLLGVAPGVSERDLRRAYARLIRAYKPEHSPEQFRRIREAYETVRSYAAFYTTFEAPADPPAPPDEDRQVAPSLSGVPESDDPAAPVEDRAPVPLPRTLDEELDEAWEWAVAGDEARAYARLLELRDAHPGRPETYLRLYCLLGLAPELDGRRKPCDFLAECLRESGGGGPCHEPYRLEIEDDPAEALTGRFVALLEATTQPGLLATFVEWRWRAAAGRGRFDVIGNDVPGLRARLAFDAEEVWLRLLAFAAGQLAWIPARPDAFGLAECLREIGTHQHLQLSSADVFDRLEFLERVAAGWHSLVKCGAVPADLLGLLSRFWARPFPEVRPAVMGLLAAIDQEKMEWLCYLDALQVYPALLALFGEILDSHQWTLDREDDDRDPDELAESARQFLEEFGGVRYGGGLRTRLLAFCLRERIDPEVVARVAIAETVPLPDARRDKLVNDWPLRHLYRACTLSGG
jgi:hypothetical protein